MAPPFGWPLKPTLFVLASAAILYPGWTFFVAAVRALRILTAMLTHGRVPVRPRAGEIPFAAADRMEVKPMLARREALDRDPQIRAIRSRLDLHRAGRGPCPIDQRDRRPAAARSQLVGRGAGCQQGKGKQHHN